MYKKIRTKADDAEKLRKAMLADPQLAQMHKVGTVDYITVAQITVHCSV